MNQDEQIKALENECNRLRVLIAHESSIGMVFRIALGEVRVLSERALEAEKAVGDAE